MNRLLLLLLIAGLIGVSYLLFRPSTEHEFKEPAVVKTGPSWRHFEPQSGKFSVDLPVIPQHASDMISDNNTQHLKVYDMYVAEGVDGAVYMINLVTYQNPEDVKDKGILFQNFINDMLISNPSNQLVTSSDVQYDGLDAKDFTLKNPDATVDSKIFLHGNTLYVLSRVSKAESPTNGDFKNFISSFKLNKRDETAPNTQKK